MTCYNRVETTIRSLESLLRAMKGFSYDVFLVDDASPDNTGAKVRERFPFTNVIRGNGSLYWAKGMRLAWETAVKQGDYDFYLWLNDDLILKRDALSGMFADYDKAGSVIVGACSEDEEETMCSYGVSDVSDKKIIPNGQPQKANGWLNGNLVLVPKEVYKRIGMISGEYTHARADYDYAERLKKASIPFYGSSQYVGVCKNDFSEKMLGMTLPQRVQMLWQPGYYNLRDLWLIRSKYHGITRAILSCVHLIYMAVRG